MAYAVLPTIKAALTGCSWATDAITFMAEKLGTRYAAAIASQRVGPMACGMLANPRKSSANVPMMNREKANTAASRGEEKVENNSASAVIITNCSTMK